MKLFALIMAFLVLVLSIVPCADINASTNYIAKTEITKSTQQKGDPQQDDCSPFCHCTCCASFSINSVITTVGSPAAITVTDFSSFSSDHLIERSLPVWKPPKI